MIQNKRIIRARRPNIIRSIVSLALLAMAGPMFLYSDSWYLQFLSWGCMVFTGVVFVRLCVRFALAQDITLTTEGFKRGRVFTPWTDVRRFGTLAMKRQTFAVFTLNDHVTPQGRIKNYLRPLPADVSGYFSPSPEMSAEEMVSLLNAWKNGRQG